MKTVKKLLTQLGGRQPTEQPPSAHQWGGFAAHQVLDSLGNAVITTDSRGQVNYLNPVAERLIGQQGSAVQGTPLIQVVTFRDELSDQYLAVPIQNVLQGRTVQLPENTSISIRDGRRVAIEGSLAPIFGSDGRVAGISLALHDVTKSREVAARLAYHARHDTLTGLVNRREFEVRVKRAMERSRLRHLDHALGFIDLDQFKIINDTCGHAAGDELLRQVAALLRSQIRQRDTLARLGGDEFGLLLEACPIKEAKVLADSLLATLQAFRFTWEGKSFGIGASIGLTAITPLSEDIVAILSAADAACYAAKEKGRNRVQVYKPDDQELADRKTEMRQVSHITDAIQANNFALYVQPILPLGARAPGDHYEILARMKGADGRLISPGQFIPTAERYNLMPSLDRLIIRHAFAAYRKAYPNAASDNTWAINISGSSLASDGFIDFIREQAAEHKIPAQAICFEITETAAIANLEKALEFILGLKIEGFRFALDDFGKGMSSFSYLKNLPVDYLKIDGEFIKEIVSDRVSAGMVDAINRIGHLMGIETIAEYVENDAILRQLRQMGVNFAQGYGIGEPVSIDVLSNVRMIRSVPQSNATENELFYQFAVPARKAAARPKQNRDSLVIL